MHTLNELCLTTTYFIFTNYFIFDNYLHILEKAGLTGLALIVMILKASLQHLEDKVIRETLTNLAPLTYNRYVDDNHTRFKDSQDCFVENRHNQNYLNSIIIKNKYQAPKTENTYNKIVKIP